ncbi:MAG: araC 4 [Anaerocolumna sp.]|nr:araC 4 [Anaerocolumna sp.]
MLFALDPDNIIKVRLMNSAVIQPPYVHNKRKVDEYVIYIIKKGKMFLEENNIKYALGPGDFILLDRDYYHGGYKPSYCEYFYIHFRNDGLIKMQYDSEQDLMKHILTKRNDSLKSDPFSYSTMENDRVMLPKYFHFQNYSDLLKTNLLLEEATAANNNHLDNYKVLCSVKVMEAFIEIYRSYVLLMTENNTKGMPKSYHKVQEILEYLNTSYVDKITSANIEEKADCNFDHINRVFKQLTHKTVFTYLNTVRINHAKQLISTTNMKMSEVGQAVGFADLYYFSKVFKKATGVSPTSFAKGMMK